MPKTSAGYPVNVSGTIKPLDSKRYLITDKNTYYITSFDQIRYISNI